MYEIAGEFSTIHRDGSAGLSQLNSANLLFHKSEEFTILVVEVRFTNGCESLAKANASKKLFGSK